MKLWGGRFKKETDELVHAYNASLDFDRRLAPQDVAGSIAWAEALHGAGVLSEDETTTLTRGLGQVGEELATGTFVFAPTDEDIHTAVERRLTEIVGALGGKLHTGRSRNDQVATDLRLWAMEACVQLDQKTAALQTALVGSAEADLLTPMPGYTHLQPAQPVTWGHWVLSHFWPLHRDRRRLAQAKIAADALPLGSGALAGTSFNIDRAWLAERLGFTSVMPNSMDAVADRGFAVDFLYAAAMIGLHLSRLSEQLTLFATPAFGFVRLDDAYTTGSSLMPQKRNPDTLELTRGKAGRLVGHLAGLMVTLKGLPSTYDKDLQEDKEPLFDACDTLTMSLQVMTGLVDSLVLQPERMAAQLDPAMLATDLADHLVELGTPFREAHGLVGQVVSQAERNNKPLNSVTLAELQAISPLFTASALGALDMMEALERRSIAGGTAAKALAIQLAQARKVLGPGRST